MDILGLFCALIGLWSIAGAFTMCMLILSHNIDKIKNSYKILLLVLSLGPVVWLGLCISWPIGKFWDYLIKE